jgi:drug/metabolite transporter (DMT)-like permease
MNANSVDQDGVSAQPAGLRGPFLLAISAVIFGAMAVAVRISGREGIPGSETAVVRFVFGLVTVLALGLTGKASLKLNRIPLLVARGVIGGAAILFYFLSLAAAKGPDAIPLTNSAFLGNSYFVYAPLFGALLIRERMCIGTVLMVIVALVGLYFIADPDFGNLRAGNVYGFLSGLLGGLALVTVRELRRTESAASIFLSLCVFGALAGLVAMLAEKPVWPDSFGWALLIGIGVTSTIGQLLMTYAMRFTRAAEAGVIQMSAVIYASAAGVIWFDDPLNVRVIVGALLVIASATYISLVQAQFVQCD